MLLMPPVVLLKGVLLMEMPLFMVTSVARVIGDYTVSDTENDDGNDAGTDDPDDEKTDAATPKMLMMMVMLTLVLRRCLPQGKGSPSMPSPGEGVHKYAFPGGRRP